MRKRHVGFLVGVKGVNSAQKHRTVNHEPSGALHEIQ